MNDASEFALKGIFIFNESGKILFSEHFYTVLSRVPFKTCELPKNCQLSLFFLDHIKDYFDCTEIQTFRYDADNILVIYLSKPFYICVIPYLGKEKQCQDHAISASCSFLTLFETLARPSLRNLMHDSPPKEFARIKQTITITCPFGKPIITEQYLTSLLTQSENEKLLASGNITTAEKIPSWKYPVSFPRQQLELQVKETLLGNVDKSSKIFKIFGELRCTASISLIHPISILIDQKNMKNIQIHQSISRMNEGEITFIPIAGTCQLLTWEVINPGEPPVTGDYEVIDKENEIKYILRFQASKSVGPVSVQLSFPGAGAIASHEFSGGIGQISLSKQDLAVQYELGGRSETEISGKFILRESRQPTEGKKHAFIGFKSHNKIYSGFNLSKESISLPLNAGPVLISVKHSFSTEPKRYKIDSK